MATMVNEDRHGYHEMLQTLSEASVHQHFDAFLDIDWDNPDFAVDRSDKRWILGREDALGRHPWYQSLPTERQIEVGIYRWALICKVGLQFEQMLISGIMNHAMTLDNSNPEFRYSTHEATEECHHTQMFQEFVNRTGCEVSGAPIWFRRLMPVASALAAWWPPLFWFGVLAGEEPIDYLQKELLRSDSHELHPLLQRIIQIHVAEEARHIGFAHQYLAEHVPQMSLRGKTALGVMVPLIMRGLCDVIMIPSKEHRLAMGIPYEVAREVWWTDPASSKQLRDLFGDVRMLTEQLGLRGPVARRMWRKMGIEGRPTRFRSQPRTATL
ncbi:MAG: AurF N-oxygenase family protein [Nocardioides sp.]